MKKVVRVVDIETVSIDKLTDDSKVGIKWGCIGEKCWVTKNKQGFVAIPIGNTDTSSCWSKPSLKEYVNYIVGDRDVEVFLFSCERELIDWLKIN